MCRLLPRKVVLVCKTVRSRLFHGAGPGPNEYSKGGVIDWALWKRMMAMPELGTPSPSTRAWGVYMSKTWGRNLWAECGQGRRPRRPCDTGAARPGQVGRCLCRQQPWGAPRPPRHEEVRHEQSHAPYGKRWTLRSHGECRGNHYRLPRSRSTTRGLHCSGRLDQS